MEIKQKLEGYVGYIDLKNYKNFLVEKKLQIVSKNQFINSSSRESYWRLKIDEIIFDIFKFTTPKRTRSFPFARLFPLLFNNTLKVALIPIVKDEGVQTDFLGLETIAILNIFNVYSIINYYESAEIKHLDNKFRLTNQKLNFKEIYENLQNIVDKNIDVHKWNESIAHKYPKILLKAKRAYENIANKLKIDSENITCIKKIEKIHLKKINEEGFEKYLQLRNKWKKVSQYSELHTIQPKEDTIDIYPGKPLDILFKDNLGFKTPLKFRTAIDEFIQIDNNLIFIEKKRNNSLNNIIESIFREIIYKNLVFSNSKFKIHFAIGITDDNLKGICYSRCKYFFQCYHENFKQCKNNFLKNHNLNIDQIIINNFYSRILYHCFMNNHICFFIGKKNKNFEESEIEKEILIRSIF
ncbi:MAG: hypothetical protein ACTSRP_02775 [Candidatus Helarchaeota archaeon]